MCEKTNHPLFAFFTQIGILEQLSRTLLEARLPDGITVSHFSVLNHLIRVSDGRTPVELSRAFQQPKTTITHVLSGLVKRNYVVFRSNPADKRSKTVWLTDEGRQFREDSILALSPDFEELLQKIDESEITKILPELNRIREIMDEMRNG